MKAKVFLLAGAALLLTGCFDAHYDLGLRNDGGGTIAIDVVLDKELSADVIKDGKGKLAKQTDHSPLGKNARSQQRVENGQVVISQVLDFKSLSEISGSGIDVSVESLGRSMFGVARSRIRLATSDHPAVPASQKPDDFGDQLIAQMFKGHAITVTMHLPCTVETAQELRRNDAVFTPQISKGWFSGSTITWQVPIADYLALQQHNGPNAFVATCWSWAGIAPGHSRPGK